MRRNARKPRPPLNAQSLSELALAYVGRFATSRAKLSAYLRRKLRERGWTGDCTPDVEGLVERFADKGYVDDAAFAVAKSRSLSARGYGPDRLRQSLRAAGIDEEDSQGARELAQSGSVDSALRFARRRRIGPFADQRPDKAGREKALAAMIRAGHDFGLARAIVDLEPGVEADTDELRSAMR